MALCETRRYSAASHVTLPGPGLVVRCDCRRCAGRHVRAVRRNLSADTRRCRPDGTFAGASLRLFLADGDSFPFAGAWPLPAAQTVHGGPALFLASLARDSF